jgi:riboflavin biosynthesis pyrimidine reductase
VLKALSDCTDVLLEGGPTLAIDRILAYVAPDPAGRAGAPQSTTSGSPTSAARCAGYERHGRQQIMAQILEAYNTHFVAQGQQYVDQLPDR